MVTQSPGIWRAAMVAAALVLGGTASAAELREISYALPSKSLVSAAPRIADELGFFANHGLKPKFTYIDSTSQTAMSVLSRSVDFGETATAEVIAAEARGQHLKLVAKHYNGLAGSVVLSKAVVARLGVSPTAPVAERLKALNNVLLASVSKISTLTISYKSAANAAGAEPRFSYMAVGAMGAALEAGAVEGILATAPYWAFPVMKGTGILWLNPASGDVPPEFVPSTPSATVTTAAFADANPQVARAVAAVFDDLTAALAERPDDVKAVIGRLYPDIDPKVLDLVLQRELKAFNTKPLTPDDIAGDIRYMKASGADYGAIDRVNPAAVVLSR